MAENDIKIIKYTITRREHSKHGLVLWKTWWELGSFRAGQGL